jgi:hypothetical protein
LVIGGGGVGQFLENGNFVGDTRLHLDEMRFDGPNIVDTETFGEFDDSRDFP